MVDEFLLAIDEGFARDRYGRTFTRDAARELHWSLDTYVREHLGTIPMAHLRRDDVEGLVYDLSKAGISRPRLRALASSVRALYDYAAEKDLVRHNPAERIALPEEDEVEQPTAGRTRPSDPTPSPGISDRAISLTLRVATLAFVLIALFFLAQSL
jgi:site-specific recombinase XerC